MYDNWYPVRTLNGRVITVTFSAGRVVGMLSYTAIVIRQFTCPN